MRNIGIMETHDTVEEFSVGRITVDKDVKIINYDPKLLQDEKFLQSIETILIIGQETRLDTIDLETLKYFSLKNVVYILTYNRKYIQQTFRQEYFLLKPYIGLVLEGNRIERYGLSFSSNVCARLKNVSDFCSTVHMDI